MKLLNIIAVAAISGLLSTAVHAMLNDNWIRENVCIMQYEACKKERVTPQGKSRCDAEKDECRLRQSLMAAH